MFICILVFSFQKIFLKEILEDRDRDFKVISDYSFFSTQPR